MSDLQTWSYRPSFVCWVPDAADDEYPYSHAHSSGDCDWGWICNGEGCNFRADVVPCTEHAPTEFPGLRLVECQAEPPHLLWAHDREDYGHGCPWCWYERTHAELEPLKAAAERRAHRWCWLFNPAKRVAIRLRLAKLWSVGDPWTGGACWHVDAKWRWRR